MFLRETLGEDCFRPPLAADTFPDDHTELRIAVQPPGRQTEIECEID